MTFFYSRQETFFLVMTVRYRLLILVYQPGWPQVVTSPEQSQGIHLLGHPVGWRQKLWNRWNFWNTQSKQRRRKYCKIFISMFSVRILRTRSLIRNNLMNLHVCVIIQSNYLVSEKLSFYIFSKLKAFWYLDD